FEVVFFAPLFMLGWAALFLWRLRHGRVVTPVFAENRNLEFLVHVSSISIRPPGRPNLPAGGGMRTPPRLHKLASGDVVYCQRGRIYGDLSEVFPLSFDVGA